MSYYNGIPDEDLVAEGWTAEQIAELRKVEKQIRERRKKEWVDEQAKWKKEWDALGLWGQKAFNELWLSSSHLSTPPETVLREAMARGKAMEQAHIERQVRLLNKKWWQFWIQ